MLKVAVVGAAGYTGAELVRVLVGHPEAELRTITSDSYQGKKVSSLYPNLGGVCDLAFAPHSAREVKSADVVFVCVPHGQSMKIVPGLLDGKRKLIDLSGDFRLETAAEYERWYGSKHTAPDLLGEAVYGLPEVNRAAIQKASFVSNPGCYPTAVVLGLAPLAGGGLVFAQDIVVDALTGVSGSGRAPSDEVHYCACDENVSSYKVGGVHQHIPEMELNLGKLAGEAVTLSFTPHVVPLSRAIYATAYADLKEDKSTAELSELYADYYRDSQFVKVLSQGEQPQAKAVAGSNFCHVSAQVDARCGRAVVISAIDNLVKGASGQAVQNMNLMCGLPEETGLTNVGLYP